MMIKLDVMKHAAVLCVAISVSLGSACWSSGAQADGWPTSVAGTWNVVANLSTGTMTIKQPSSAQYCRGITGTISLAGAPTDTIQGFYCIRSGLIVFARIRSGLAPPIQFYRANVSQDAAIDRMGGTFSQLVGGSYGEYNFSGTK